LVAGLLGMRPDDERIPDALTQAQEQGLSVGFLEADLGEVHPNTAAFELECGDKRLRVQGSSLGGGDVVITDIDGFEVQVSGELPIVIVDHQDRPGEVAAVTAILAESGANIASMQVSRERRGARALMLIETDSGIEESVARRIEGLDGVTSVRRIAAV